MLILMFSQVVDFLNAGCMGQQIGKSDVAVMAMGLSGHMSQEQWNKISI